MTYDIEVETKILDENPEEKTLISTPKTGLQFAAVNNLEDIKIYNLYIFHYVH